MLLDWLAGPQGPDLSHILSGCRLRSEERGSSSRTGGRGRRNLARKLVSEVQIGRPPGPAGAKPKSEAPIFPLCTTWQA